MSVAAPATDEVSRLSTEITVLKKSLDDARLAADANLAAALEERQKRLNAEGEVRRAQRIATEASREANRAEGRIWKLEANNRRLIAGLKKVHDHARSAGELGTQHLVEIALAEHPVDSADV